MLRQTVALLVTAAFLLSPLRVLAVDHIVSADELAMRLAVAEEHRLLDIQTLSELLRKDAALAALADAGISPEQVQRAIPQLDDKTLAHFAEQSRRLDADVVAAGYPGGRYFGLYVLAALLILFILWGTVIADGYGT